MAACVEEEDDFCFVEPFFYDEARDLAMRARALEMTRLEEEEKAREEEEKARKVEENRRRGLDHERVMQSIVEYDPKTKRKVYTRYPFDDFNLFDINEESHTSNAIHPEEENLILTGPGRGLVLLDFIYLEIDLKIKVGEELLGEQISKGLLMIDGRVLPRDEKVNVGHQTLDSWFSIVEVRYATILNAVEATFEIVLLEGCFCGKIMAGINGIEPRIVIYNSGQDGVVPCEDRTVITLRRCVMTLRLSGMLTFGFEFRGGGGCGTRKQKVEFTPQHRGEEKKEISCGTAKLQVKVFWSMMDYRP